MVVAPDSLLACAVCFDARDENRIAFLATTAFLSLLPLGMVAGAGVFIRKRVREMDQEAEAYARGWEAEEEQGGAPPSSGTDPRAGHR